MPSRKKNHSQKTGSKKRNTKKKSVKKVSPERKSTDTIQELSSQKKFSKGMCKLYEQGLKLLHRNSYKESREKFVQLSEKFPTEIEVISRIKTFIRICDRHLDLEQSQPALTPEVIFNQAAIHHNAKRYEEALETLSQAIKLTPKKRDYIYYSMAAAEICMGNTDQSLKYLKKAITMNEENRFFASNDPDFDLVTENPEFEELIHPE